MTPPPSGGTEGILLRTGDDGLRTTSPSRQNRLHDLRLLLDARQALVQALELVDQLLVVQAQQVEDGRVDVPDMHRVLHDVVAEVVGLAVRDARLDARAREPVDEAARVMVAPVVAPRQLPLAVRRAAEFAAPDDQRL